MRVDTDFSNQFEDFGHGTNELSLGDFLINCSRRENNLNHNYMRPTSEKSANI